MNPTIEHIASILGRDAVLAACCGVVVAALAFLIARIPAFSATTRHAVWVLAIITLGAMPLAAIGQSVLEGRVIEHRAAVASGNDGDRASRFRADAFEPPRSGLLKRVIITLGRSHPRLATAVAASTHPTLPSLANHARIAAVARFIPIAFLAAWIVGVFVGLGFLTASLLRVVGLKRRSSPLSEELSTQLPWLTEGTGREIMLRLSFEIETPVAVGFRRPVVLIPTELVDENGLGQIEELVQHEYAHLRRYDDWTNLVQRIVERIFWWNPVVALVGRRIALEREIAADDCVVASGAAPQRYAQSLWRLAREMRMPEHSAVAPGALFTRKQISIRIEQLLDDRRNARPRVAPGAMFAAAGLAFVGIIAVVSAAPAFEITRELPPIADLATPEPEPSAPAMRLLVLHDPSPMPVTAHPGARRVTVIATVTPLATATDRAQSERGQPDRKTIAYSYTVDANEPTAPPTTTIPSAPPAPTAPPAAAAVGSARIAPPLPIPPPSPGASGDLSSAREQVSRASKSLVAAVLRDALGSSGSESDADGTHSGHARHGRDDESLAHCNGCDLSGHSFRGQDLRGITLYGADLSSADLRDVNLQGAHLNGVDLSSATLDNADLRGAVLTGVDLSSTSMRNVKIDGLRMNGATLDGTNVRGVPMRTLLEACYGCNFANFDFHGADLHGVQFHGLNLSDANFSGANLRGAIFAGANLNDANFDNADLRDASFAGSNLHDASFDGAQLDRTNFAGSARRTKRS